MMKQWVQKVGLVAASVAALTTLVSAAPVNADASRVVYFTVQNNARCVADGEYYNFIFNVNNISSVPVDVKVQLYNNDGQEVITGGTNTSTTTGIYNSFMTGSTFTLPAKSTRQIFATYGSPTGVSCSARPAFGKVTIESDGGLLMANGETRSATASASTILDAPIIVNNGQPF